MQIDFSPRADADLEDIYRYTWSECGSAQADQYVETFRAVIASTQSEPWRVRPCPDIRRGYSRIMFGSHIAFLRQRAGRWIVVRILHERQDTRRHL